MSVSNSRIAPPWSRHLGRHAATLCLIGASLWFARGPVAQLDFDEIWRHLQIITFGQWALAALFTLVAFLAVAGQEAAVNDWLGSKGPRMRSSGMAAAAISQVLGFGPIIGTLVRLRLRPDLTLAKAAAVTGAITVLFLIGLALFTGLAALVFPHPVMAVERRWALLGLAGVSLGGFALLVLAARRFPNVTPRFLMRMFSVVWIDISALCLSFWVLMPDLAAITLEGAVSVFGLALAAGLLAGSPAGAGPFEAIVLSHLAGGQGNAVAAGLIAFRLMSYATPALLGVGWALFAPAPKAARPDPADLGKYSEFNACPRAEMQLCHQGNFALTAVLPGIFWLRAKVLGGEVWMGDPAGLHRMPRNPGRSLEAVLRGGRQARLFYRIGARTAVQARKSGQHVLHFADEAILRPADFCLQQSGRSALRRKLKKARNAGLQIVQAPILPPVLLIDQMEAVHREWMELRGGQRGFTMGIWHPDFVRKQRVFLARDAEGRLLAFVTFHVSAAEWTLDLIRFRKSTPDGALYALVHAAVMACRDQGVPRLSLAAAPAVAVPGLWGRVLSLCTTGSRGLRQFKETFRPSWEPRYLAAAGRGQMLGLLAVLLWNIQKPPALAADMTTPAENRLAA